MQVEEVYESYMLANFSIKIDKFQDIGANQKGNN